jgi:predicted glycosyltransferase
MGNGLGAREDPHRTPMTRKPAILFQPQNHVGLGHINRLAAIAVALQQINPSVRTPFVVEGAAHVLLDALNLPYVPLPSSHLMSSTAEWSQWSKEERSGITLQISHAILDGLQPQVVVFDCFPNIEFVKAVIERKLPIVLCLREVKSLDRYLDRLTAILPYVHRILIPHDAGMFELPESLRKKSICVGEIVRPLSVQSRPDPGLDSRRIVISGGGGGYPDTVRFYNLSLQALEKLRCSDSTLQGRLIAGPLFSDWMRLQLVNGVTVTPFVPDVPEAFSTADMVVCQAGYNTVAEALQSGTRTILAPAERVWDDQFARASRMELQHKSFRVFRGSSHVELTQMINLWLQEPQVPLETSRPDGALRAAEHLCSML